ncbi:MAG: hypothetical protein ACKOAC_08810, partial [Fluviibacter sp.]
MPSRLPTFSREFLTHGAPAPMGVRLPLAVWVATLGFGGAVLMVSTPVFAQSSSTPVRMEPLLVDPALLGGTPATPSSGAAALGGMPSSGPVSKKGAPKKVVQQPIIQAPAQPVVAEAAPVAETSVPTTAPVPAKSSKVAAAPSKSEPAPEPVAPEPVPAPEPEPSPTPAPAPSAPSAPSAPRTPAPTQPVAETTTKPQSPALAKDQTELLADVITGRNDLELTATGNAELRRDGTILNADRIVYSIVEDNVDAQGNVLYRDPAQGTTMAGTDADIVVAARTGYINNANYEIRQKKQIAQVNQGPWSFNAPPLGATPTASTGAAVPMGGTNVPTYGVAASSTLTQQPGQQTAINEAVASGADAETQAQTASMGGTAFLPGQTPLAKIVETMSHGQAARINLEGENRYRAE